MSERYEGLSLPDLLALMHENVEPGAISLLPATEAWLVLAGWVVAVLAVALAAWRRRWQRNRYRREALRTLANIEADAGLDASASAARVAELVKRTALAAYPRDRVASLYGACWSTFLIESARQDRRVVAGADELASAAWSPGAGGPDLIPAARRWIKVHRV
jgi:hypothetical protein